LEQFNLIDTDKPSDLCVRGHRKGNRCLVLRISIQREFDRAKIILKSCGRFPAPTSMFYLCVRG
jgi:hypothetical protein